MFLPRDWRYRNSIFFSLVPPNSGSLRWALPYSAFSGATDRGLVRRSGLPLPPAWSEVVWRSLSSSWFPDLSHGLTVVGLLALRSIHHLSLALSSQAPSPNQWQALAGHWGKGRGGGKSRSFSFSQFLVALGAWLGSFHGSITHREALIGG